MSNIRDGIIDQKFAIHLLKKYGPPPKKGDKRKMTANHRQILDFYMLAEIAESTDITLVYFKPTASLADAIKSLGSYEGFLWSSQGDLHSYFTTRCGQFMSYIVTGNEGKTVHEEVDTKAEFVRVFGEVESDQMIED